MSHPSTGREDAPNAPSTTRRCPARTFTAPRCPPPDLLHQGFAPPGIQGQGDHGFAAGGRRAGDVHQVPVVLGRPLGEVLPVGVLLVVVAQAVTGVGDAQLEDLGAADQVGLAQPGLHPAPPGHLGVLGFRVQQQERRCPDPHDRGVPAGPRVVHHHRPVRCGQRQQPGLFPGQRELPGSARLRRSPGTPTAWSTCDARSARRWAPTPPPGTRPGAPTPPQPAAHRRAGRPRTRCRR